MDQWDYFTSFQFKSKSISSWLHCKAIPNVPHLLRTPFYFKWLILVEKIPKGWQWWVGAHLGQVRSFHLEMTFSRTREILEPVFGPLWGIVWECQIRFGSTFSINSFEQFTVEYACYNFPNHIWKHSLTGSKLENTSSSFVPWIFSLAPESDKAPALDQNHPGQAELSNIQLKQGFFCFCFLLFCILLRNNFCCVFISCIAIQNIIDGFGRFLNSIVNSQKYEGTPSLKQYNKLPDKSFIFKHCLIA